MSLDTAEALFINELLEIWETESEETEDPAASRLRIAQKMAQAIKKFIKSGQVNITVTTTGTASAQTGTGTGNIS